MTYKLFLDDERLPVKRDCFIARTYEEARSIVCVWGIPLFVSFDHDLGKGPTGKDFANWLIEYILDHRDEFDPANFSYYVHSQNPVGVADIRALLDGFLKFLKENHDVGDVGQAEEGSGRGAQDEELGGDDVPVHADRGREHVRDQGR